MNIDITRLLNNLESHIEIEETLEIPNELLTTTEIRSIKPVNVTGSLSKHDVDDEVEIFSIYLNIKGEMILPCSITLEDVIFPFDIEYSCDVSEDEENLKIIGNYVDILPIIWENIITEIPIRVVSLTAKLENTKGEGWQVITDDLKRDNQFGVLRDLLKEKEDE